MIELFHRELAAGLRRIRKVAVYDEDVNQDIEVPCFIVTPYSETPANGINKCKKNVLSINITYIPESTEEPNSECRKVASDMNMELYIEGFKIRERSVHIENGMLQYGFKTAYRVYSETTEPEMKEYDVNIKEE